MRGSKTLGFDHGFPYNDCVLCSGVILQLGSSEMTLDVTWEPIRERLRNDLGEAVYNDWIRKLSFLGVEDGVVLLGAPGKFVRDWVESHYADAIQSFFDRPVRVVELSEEIAESCEIVESTRPAEDEEFHSAILDPRLTFDNFVVGKPNEFAYAAARRIADSEEATYNPLFLYGPVGHGKTHLMHAIAHHILARFGRRKKVFYLSAEKFMYHFVKALRYKDTVSFKEKFRSVDVLMIDDVQFISGKDSTQEEFFHTFNALVDQRRQVVISADKSPADLEGMQERMKSRLGWGLVADLHPCTYELRLGILQARTERMGVNVPQKILEFLAQRISSNIRELEGALTRIVAHATLIGRELSVEMAQDVLRDLLRSHERDVTIDDIQKRVAEYYSIRVTDLSSAKRTRHIARPRQIAMFLAKNMTTASLPNIGRAFGGRDHSTVIHAVQVIHQISEQDVALRNDLALLRRALEE